MVRISAFHAGGPGSIPGVGILFFVVQQWIITHTLVLTREKRQDTNQHHFSCYCSHSLGDIHSFLLSAISHMTDTLRASTFHPESIYANDQQPPSYYESITTDPTDQINFDPAEHVYAIISEQPLPSSRSPQRFFYFFSLSVSHGFHCIFRFVSGQRTTVPPCNSMYQGRRLSVQTFLSPARRIYFTLVVVGDLKSDLFFFISPMIIKVSQRNQTRLRWL